MEIIVIFEIAPKYCISDPFVHYEGYSISSKGFLPTVIDIWSSELNSPIPVHLVHWFLGCCFLFGPASSFLLELLGSSSFNVISFCLFILSMGFSRQESWSGFPFPSPVDHILSELSTMTRLSWVALHGIDHGFIELGEAVVHVIRLVSFLWLWFSFCLPSDGWR